MTFFNVLLFIISILVLIYIVKTVNSDSFFINYAFQWLLVGIITLVAAIKPKWFYNLSDLAGFETPINFILFVCVLFLSYQVISLISIISVQNKKITKLIQEVSLLKKKMEDD